MWLGYLDRLGLGERRFDIATLTIAEHHAEHRERELTVGRFATLRLRREDAALEHATSLHRLEVEAVILVALTLERAELRHFLLEIFEPLRQKLLELGHEFASDRCAISRQRQTIMSIIFPHREGSS